MVVIVGRILTRHLPWFKDHFLETSTKHIVHDFAEQSCLRSVLVNVGVFDENPSSTQGAVGIYEKLQSYIPYINGKPYPTLIYCDGLSCERGNDAKNARSNGVDDWERLDGLEPAVQEFHKEIILLQDYFDLFFKGSSISDRGTLCHLKNIFNFRQVKGDISDNFNHAWELMSIATKGSVCLLAMEILKMNDKSDRPTDSPEGIETCSFDERKEHLNNICQALVDKIWYQTDVNTLKRHDDQVPEVFCCGEEIDDIVIACFNGLNCPHGQYFHSSCVNVDTQNIPESWFCSEECKNSQIYSYCHCRVDLGMDEPMIDCSAEEKCLGVEWYHYKCVDISVNNIPTGDWFSQEGCKDAKRGKDKSEDGDVVNDANDFVYNYGKALLWYGLNLLCRRDAVREADGHAMMSHWKIDNLHFFTVKHPKYLILSHRLLASIGGWLPDKLIEDLIHNRTVNYGGGIGRNLPMDFMNEVLNRLFKDLLDSAKGLYTNSTIQRCSHIVGPLGEALDALFDEKIIKNELYRHKRRAHNRDSNITKFITFLKNDRIFSRTNGRRHRAFPSFIYSCNPKHPEKFLAKMHQLSEHLDRRRSLLLLSQQ